MVRTKTSHGHYVTLISLSLKHTYPHIHMRILPHLHILSNTHTVLRLNYEYESIFPGLNRVGIRISFIISNKRSRLSIKSIVQLFINNGENIRNKYTVY